MKPSLLKKDDDEVKLDATLEWISWMREGDLNVERRYDKEETKKKEMKNALNLQKIRGEFSVLEMPSFFSCLFLALFYVQLFCLLFCFLFCFFVV